MSKTLVPLQILIIGGGIAGLSAALALRQSGHKVTLLEGRPSLSEVGAGVQIHANASRLLISWELKGEMEKIAEPAMPLLLTDYSTGALIREFPPERDADKFPTWLVHRYELQKVLYDAAVAAGAEVVFDARVTGIDFHRCSGTTRDGSVHTADLILVADGIGSKNRRTVIRQEVQPIFRHGAYRLLIPRSTMLRYPETAALMERPHRQVWSGPTNSVIGYPISRGRFYNVVMEHPSTKLVPGVWNTTGDVAAMKAEYSAYHRVVQRLMDIAPTCTLWALARLPRLPRWTDESGRVLLFGDAAHATTPQLAQGAGMCIEDAAVLVECLADVASVGDVPAATRRFVALRKERTESVQQHAWDSPRTFHTKNSSDGSRGFAVKVSRTDVVAEARRFLRKESL